MCKSRCSFEVSFADQILNGAAYQTAKMGTFDRVELLGPPRHDATKRKPLLHNELAQS